MKQPSKLEQIRTLREAKAKRLEGGRTTQRPPVTEKLREAVTDNTVAPTKRGRGRPSKPDALSNAERQRAFRARKAKGAG